MVFLNGVYKAFLLFVVFSIFFMVLDAAFGIVLWPGLVHSVENYLVLFIFALTVVFSATY